MKKYNKLILKVFIYLYIIVLIVIQINTIMPFITIFTRMKIEPGIYLKKPFSTKILHYPDNLENELLIKNYCYLGDDWKENKTNSYWKKNDNNQVYSHYKELYDLLGIKGKNLISDYLNKVPNLFSLDNYYYVVKDKTKNKYNNRKIIKELLIFDTNNGNVYHFLIIEPSKI